MNPPTLRDDNCMSKMRKLSSQIPLREEGSLCLTEYMYLEPLNPARAQGNNSLSVRSSCWDREIWAIGMQWRSLGWMSSQPAEVILPVAMLKVLRTSLMSCRSSTVSATFCASQCLVLDFCWCFHEHSSKICPSWLRVVLVVYITFHFLDLKQFSLMHLKVRNCTYIFF